MAACPSLCLSHLNVLPILGGLRLKVIETSLHDLLTHITSIPPLHDHPDISALSPVSPKSTLGRVDSSTQPAPNLFARVLVD
jgi:hypothetical protein